MDHQLGIGQSFSISAATWFPQPTLNLSGTIDTTQGRLIIGTGTKFRTEVSPGDWILIAGDNEVQQVMTIDDDTTLHLQNPFAGTTSATATYKRIKEGGLKELDVMFITSTGTTRGASQALGSDASFPAGIPMPPFKYAGRLDPQLVTPGGGGTAFVRIVI
jgi:hypothetical protein